MKQISLRLIIPLAVLLLALSVAALLINLFFYKYQGNSFFPEGIPQLVITLILFSVGSNLYFSKGNKIRQIGPELLYFVAVMSLIALASNAVQLTPFPPIDKYIVALERHFHIHMESILSWTNNHPKFKSILVGIYASLDYQMTIFPLLVIVTYRFHLIREYYFLLLCTTLIGFGFYYFFPTTAPASIINSPFFFTEQIDTGLKFSQIHHYINPTTNEGGLIAFPSFHVIWAILCVNLLREWVVPCILLLVTNLLLIASCVLLGWHYVTDIIGGFIVLLISCAFLKWYNAICLQT
jgi:membrane-associated phospholipid phosphatase